MKHVIILFTLLLSTVATAQKFYFKAGAGYALPLSNSRTLEVTGFPYTGSNISPNNDRPLPIPKASMFSGVRGIVGAGFMFSKLGFELNAVSVLNNIKYTKAENLSVYSSGTTNITVSSQYPTMLMPTLVMKVPGKMLDIYLRAGVVLPVYKRIIVEAATQTDSANYYNKTELKTNFGVGFAFSGGIEYKLTRNLKLWGGIDIITMSFKTKELNLLEASVNGKNVMDDRMPYQKKTFYVNNLADYTFSVDRPTQAIAYSIPYSTKGISIGISYGL